MKKHLDLWFQLYSTLDKKHMQKYQSDKLKKKIYTKKFLSIWKKQYDHINKKRSLQERKAQFQRDVTKRKYLARWVTIFSKNCSLQNKGDHIDQIKRHKLLAKALYALRKYKDVKIRAKHIRKAMHDHRQQIILTKCMDAWKRYTPERQLKHVLCDELSNDYRLKLQKQVFKAFELNRQFRLERRETDTLMTQAIQEISKKKFFKYWRSLSGKRLGLIMFEETFQKLQITSFFKRGRRKILHERETQSHMNLLRDYLCLQKTFGALKK